jgi:hypothetical protein
LEYLQELRTSLFKVVNGNVPFGFYSECYVWHQSVILSVIIGHKIGANGLQPYAVGAFNHCTNLEVQNYE